MRRLPAHIALLAATLIGGCSHAPKGNAPTLAAAAGNVTAARLAAADTEPGNWFTAGRDAGKTHYSPLKAINTENVGTLGFAWQYTTGTTRGLEATPIVVDGVMYTSGVAGRVYALDAATGEPLWSFDPHIDMQAYRFACCDAVNHGVSVWNGHVYVAALDGRLFSLDAATGAVQWSVDTIDNKSRSYTITGAPEVAGDVLVIGNAGSDYDARGYISAYVLNTGALKWRFYTVPGDPKNGFENPELEAAAKTWDPDSRWDIGGGGNVWDTILYDPEFNLIYFGTGNGEPHSASERSPKGGDNLYIASIVALHADTGRLAWYVQEAPGDSWDYDATQPMILADLTVGGEAHKVLMQATKTGFFYIIDRPTGKVLSATPYVPVTWASGVDLATGRVQVNHTIADYSALPKLIFPSGQGGHNWNPMSFDRDNGLVYIPVIEAGEYVFEPPGREPMRPHARNMKTIGIFSGNLAAALPRLPPDVRRVLESGQLQKNQPDTRMRALLRAWDPVAGKTVWEAESPGGFWDRAGVLSTAGNLVFQGTGTGHFRVFDARSGSLLKDIDVGTSIIAAPMTYTVKGKQYVAVMAGWGGAGWYNIQQGNSAGVYGNAGRVLAFQLGGGTAPKPLTLPAVGPIPEPPPLSSDAHSVEHGSQLFFTYCVYCHTDAEHTGSADLRRLSPAVHATFKDIVLHGQRLPLGMARFDDVLSNADADDIHAYLISHAWEAFLGQQQSGSTGTNGATVTH